MSSYKSTSQGCHTHCPAYAAHTLLSLSYTAAAGRAINARMSAFLARCTARGYHRHRALPARCACGVVALGLATAGAHGCYALRWMLPSSTSELKCSEHRLAAGREASDKNTTPTTTDSGSICALAKQAFQHNVTARDRSSAVGYRLVGRALGA